MKFTKPTFTLPGVKLSPESEAFLAGKEVPKQKNSFPDDDVKGFVMNDLEQANENPTQMEDLAEKVNKKQKEFLKKRMEELGLPFEEYTGRIKRIHYEGFHERLQYHEYIIDEGEPNQIFLFSEVSGIIYKDGTFNFVLEFSTEPHPSKDESKY